jgi:hypothetical protein
MRTQQIQQGGTMKTPFVSAAQMRRQILNSGTFDRDKLLQAVCRDRGEFYFAEASRYFRLGDRHSALAAVEEGLLSSRGPFYLAVRDKLEELRTQLRAVKSARKVAVTRIALA